jgi:hypothetical protein
MPEISHPLAHCEAAKAYYYAWADTCNEYPMGNKIREAAHVEFITVRRVLTARLDNVRAVGKMPGAGRVGR